LVTFPKVATGDNKKEIDAALQSIFEWQRHLIRGIQQDKGKQDIAGNIPPNSVLWIRDWGMKILPQRFREPMSDWFGKRGIANHVDSIFICDEKGNITKVTYITLVENCIQDAYAVLCVFKHVLIQLMKDFPTINTIYDRSDNAGCYANINVNLGKAAIAKELGIFLKRSDFSEPQRGKQFNKYIGESGAI
jgi:hypothetical protein